MGTWRHLKDTFAERRGEWPLLELSEPRRPYMISLALLILVATFIGIVFPLRGLWDWLWAMPVLLTLALGGAVAVAGLLPARWKTVRLRRALTWGMKSLMYVFSAWGLVWAVSLAVVISVQISKLLASGILWLVGLPFRTDGFLTPAAQYVIMTLALTILAHGTRWLFIPVIKILNFPAKGEGHLRWERTLLRGILAASFRQRAYELGTLFIIVSTLSELGAVQLTPLPSYLAPSAVLGGLVTFLAIDTYIATFFPKHVQGDQAIDVVAVAATAMPIRPPDQPSAGERGSR